MSEREEKSLRVGTLEIRRMAQEWLAQGCQNPEEFADKIIQRAQLARKVERDE